MSVSKPHSRPRYQYRVVAYNGAGIHSGWFNSFGKAREAATKVVSREEGQRVKLGPYEIERGLETEYGGTRYWMRQAARWVPWHHARDEADRQPDFLVGEARGL